MPSFSFRPRTRCAAVELFEARRLMAADPIWANSFGPDDSTAPAVVATQLTQPLQDLVASDSRYAPHAAAQAWGLDGSGQTVAIVDSGVAYDHVALGGGFGPGHRIVGGWDFAENDADPYDDPPSGFHGTHVAGIVASSDDQHPGLAPGVDLVVLRVFNDSGESHASWLSDALDWIHQNRLAFRYPITTVNLSISYTSSGVSADTWREIDTQLARLRDDGMFVAVAAGNDYGASKTTLPPLAASPYVVPVASAGQDGSLSTFTRRHPRVLVAPGEGIISTAPDYVEDFNGITDDFLAASGTSMAAPFVAASAVLVREAMQMAGHTRIDQDAIYGHLRETADRVPDDSSGQRLHRVNVHRAIDQIMSNLPQSAPPDTRHDQVPEAEPTDLGTVDFRPLAVSHDVPVARYRLTAAHSGLLTVHATGRGIGPQTRIRLHSSDSLLPTQVQIDGQSARSDFQVRTGQAYRLVVEGTAGEYQLILVNQVQVRDGVIQVTGSSRADDIRVMLGPETVVQVSGVEYRFDTRAATVIQIDAGAGEDVLVVHGAAIGQRVTIDQGHVDLRSKRLELRADSFESITVAAAGGHDVGELTDTAGNDLFSSYTQTSWMKGPGYYYELTGFEEVTAHALHGGDDKARLFDSPANDSFEATPDHARLTRPGSVVLVRGFENVEARARFGGFDVARLGDSPGDDLVVHARRSSRLSGPGFQVSAHDFQRVAAHATQGGRDRARYVEVGRRDVFFGLQQFSQLRRPRTQSQTWGFAEVEVRTYDRVPLQRYVSAVDYLFRHTTEPRPRRG